MKKDNFPGEKSVALLLDPDKTGDEQLRHILELATECRTDYIFVGGSLTFNSVDNLISSIKERCPVPVVLFPGNLLQLSHKADAILLLSLISGRNPELLIGNHVTAAPFLRDIREKLISAGYILVGCGSRTAVEYISQTEAIPSGKPEIVVATALAGEMLGLSIIYLEAGSGADFPVPPEIISIVRKNISIPIIAGGGIRNRDQIAAAFNAGANMVVLGNGCEKNPALLKEACEIRDKLLQKNSPE